MTVLPAVLLGYLLGSVPFGLILTRLGGAGDVRAVGSGNIGATNVLRTGRKGLAAATLLLDGLKGFAAVLLAEAWWPGGGAAAGVAAIVGHCFPVWLRFHGGKGVATLLGVSFALSLAVGLAATLAWLAVMGLTRISSLGGMAAAVVAPAVALVVGLPEAALALAVAAALVLWQHRGNIARLRTGTEPRIGGKS